MIHFILIMFKCVFNCYYVFAMLVFRGPQGRLVLPTESPSLNKVIIYLLTYLLTYLIVTLSREYPQQVVGYVHYKSDSRDCLVAVHLFTYVVACI